MIPESVMQGPVRLRRAGCSREAAFLARSHRIKSGSHMSAQMLLQ